MKRMSAGWTFIRPQSKKVKEGILWENGWFRRSEEDLELAAWYRAVFAIMTHDYVGLVWQSSMFLTPQRKHLDNGQTGLPQIL